MRIQACRTKAASLVYQRTRRIEHRSSVARLERGTPMRSLGGDPSVTHECNGAQRTTPTVLPRATQPSRRTRMNDTNASLGYMTSYL